MREELIALFARCYDISQKGKYFVWCDYAPHCNVISVYYNKGEYTDLEFILLAKLFDVNVLDFINKQLDNLER